MAMSKSLGHDILDARGYVRTAPTLRLAEYKNQEHLPNGRHRIALDEQRSIAKTSGLAKFVAENDIGLITGAESKFIKGHSRSSSLRIERYDGTQKLQYV